MTLGNALQIGRSGLNAAQAGIEVTGNNLANAATRGYHRQRLDLMTAGDQAIGNGAFVGRGVQVEAIVRQINAALEGRLRGSIADEAGSLAVRDVLIQIEGIQNELTDNDLSSHLAAFFNAWSELANAPDSFAQRTLVVQEGANLASYIRDQEDKLVELRDQVDTQIADSLDSVNDLLQQIEDLNDQIARVERGQGGASSLRDQRDVVLSELSEYADISIVELDSGMVEVFIGSTPIVLNGDARPLELRTQIVSGEPQVDVIVAEDGRVVTPTSGKLGGLLEARQQHVQGVIDQLDDFSAALILEVNRIHTQGQGKINFDTVTGTAQVADSTAVLNTTDAGLAFTPVHGSFQLHVTQKSTNQRNTSTIDIDLDGINPASDTTLDSLIAQINGVASVTASATADGRLTISGATNDIEISFSNDTSDVLAALGINTYFSGSGARDIAVNETVNNDPDHLATGIEHIPGDNRNSLAISELRDERLDSLGGESLTNLWGRTIEDFATRLGQERLTLETNTAVRENLAAQQQSVSGVSTDEEAINLLSFQRAYQGSARFLSVVDELLQTLISII